MRRSLISIAVFLLACTSASAQQYYAGQYAPPQMVVSAPPPPPMRSELGGGFIEFIFGGGDTRQQQAPPPRIYGVAPPPPPQQQVYANVGPVDPMLEPNGFHMDPQFQRQEVPDSGSQAPGTIVIDTPNHFLYLVQEGGRAWRYGIGVGRPGFTWAGTHQISAKKEWPDWVPPKEMLERQPNLPRFMRGGPNNPLGARALYLGSTLYRIHGSNEPWTIGGNVSSGCIRMRNVDVIDLYDRVKVGAKVVVL
jgi:lipoprotein-anchoring transpeptidase ErfK/SrfK